LSGRGGWSPVLSAVLVAGLVAGAAMGYGLVSGEVSGLRSWVQQLQGQVAALEGNRTSLLGRVSGLQVENKGLRQSIAALEAQVQQLRASSNISVLGVYFSPRGGAAQQVIYWIGRANRSVHILIYSFTLDGIGDAVLQAYRRGVEVQIVFEKSQVSKFSEYFRLRAAGVSVRNDTNAGLMHDKVAVIDGYVVLTGSFNWTASAEEDNNENLIVVRSAGLAAAYEQQFQRIWGLSVGILTAHPGQSA